MRKHIENEVETYFPNIIQIFDKRQTQMMERMVQEESTVALIEAEEEPPPELTDHEFIMRDPLLFGDYRNACNEDEPRYYEDLLDYDAIYFLLREIADEYNERRGKLQLVLFEDALEHLTRIHRGIRMHKGHMLIVGVGGSGKQSLTRLASFAAGKLFLNKGKGKRTCYAYQFYIYAYQRTIILIFKAKFEDIRKKNHIYFIKIYKFVHHLMNDVQIITF